MGKGNILVVDDEADIREILQFNLENAGYHVDCALSAEDALEKLSPDHGRVNAVLRRSSQQPARPVENVIVRGNIRIDVVRKMVYSDDKPVMLSKKEFEILLLLAGNEGKVFSREAIIEELWKDAPYVLDRTVDVHIARIRGKLGENKNYLTNRSGYGYCFNTEK